jgi:hypothetical protein
MRDKHESGTPGHGDSHLRGGQKKGKDKKDGGAGGNMGAGRSGNEGLGSEKPTDDMGSSKPGSKYKKSGR